MTVTKKLWIGIAVLIVLTPLGLILPDYFKAGDAWGEWGTDTIQKLVGYVPQGLQKFSSLWSAPLPDYAFKGWEDKGMAYLSFAYIIAAIVGIAVISSIVFFLGKLLAKNND
jgi:purine-cytosine permease-like protein